MLMVERYKYGIIEFIVADEALLIKTPLQCLKIQEKTYLNRPWLAIVRDEVRSGNVQSIAAMCGLFYDKRREEVGLELIGSREQWHDS